MTYGHSRITDEAGTGAVFEVQNPQAVHRPDRDETVVVYRGDDADPFVTRFDHGTERFDDPVHVGDNPIPDTDNHGVPSLCIDGAGYVYVFYGSHNSPIQVARSSNPNDIQNWTERAPLDDPGGTYPQPVSLDGDLYVFYRAGRGHGDTYPVHEYATVVRSDDGGASWTDLGPIVDLSGHPADAIDAYVMDGDVHRGRFRLTWGIAHGTHHDDIRAHAFHAAFDPETNCLYGLDGTDFGRSVTWERMEGSVLQAFQGRHANQPKHAFHGDDTYIVTNHLPPDVLENNPATEDVATLSVSDELDGNAVQRRISMWDDGAESWAVETLPGGPTQHVFNCCYPRIDDTGTLEIHAITGGAKITTTERGGDFEVFRRESDGWVRETVVTAGDNGNHQFDRLSTVRDGSDELASLFNEASDRCDRFDLSLFACGTVF